MEDKAQLYKLKRKTDQCTIFFRWVNKENASHILEQPWNTMGQEFSKIFDPEQVLLKIDRGTVKFDGWLIAKDFFQDQNIFDQVYSRMQVLVLRRDECVFRYFDKFLFLSNLTPVLSAAVKRAIYSDSKLEKAWTRRLVLFAFENGLSVSYLDQVDPSASKLIKDDVELKFERSAEIGPTALMVAFDYSINSFFKVLRPPPIHESNIATWFWGAAANQYFCNTDSGIIRCQLEWSTKSLHKRIDNRRIDCVGLISLEEKELPLLMIEVGLDSVDNAESHKDFKKITHLLIIGCSRLMISLYESDRDPSEARCYGIVAGGTKAHCIVAHASIHNGKWYVQVTTDPSWTIDMLSSEQNVSILDYISSDSVVDNSINSIESQSETPIAMTGLESITYNPDKNVFLSFQLQETTKPTEFVLDHNETEVFDEEEEDQSDEYEEEEEEVSSSNSKRVKSTDLPSESYPRGPSLIGLQRLHLFFDIISERAKILKELPANPDNNQPAPKVPSTPLKAPKSMRAPDTDPRTQMTSVPLAGRLNKENKPLKKMSQPKFVDYNERFTIIKYDADVEVQLYNIATKSACQLLPRNYSINIDEDTDETTFELERMTSFIDPANNEMPSAIIFQSRYSPRVHMVLGIKMALDTLVSLHYIHDFIEVLHNNIAPEHIMYSWVDHCFKFIDFKYMTQICRTMSNEIDYGVTGFQAPEVEKHGLNSTASDVFALGAVFSKVLIKTLPTDYRRDDFDNFFRLIDQMIDKDPQKRPKVKHAIKICLKAFKLECSDYQDIIILAAEGIVDVMNRLEPEVVEQEDAIIVDRDQNLNVEHAVVNDESDKPQTISIDEDTENKVPSGGNLMPTINEKQHLSNKTDETNTKSV